MLTTTLPLLRGHDACAPGYDLVAKHFADADTIPLEFILDNNEAAGRGLEDCIWSLRTCEGGLVAAQEFAIRVAKTVYTEPTYILWADKWLSGEDRSLESAYAADYATYATSATRAAARADQIAILREIITRGAY